MTRRCIACCVTLLLVLSEAVVGLQQKSVSTPKRVLVTGLLIGYSIQSRIRSDQGSVTSLPRDEFLVLVEKGDGQVHRGDYVKIQYKTQRRQNLPDAFFNKSSRRTFKLERDESCDEPPDSFVYGDRLKGTQSDINTARKYPNLFRLSGAKKVPLPKESMLRCYSFGIDDIVKSPEQ